MIPACQTLSRHKARGEGRRAEDSRLDRISNLPVLFQLQGSLPPAFRGNFPLEIHAGVNSGIPAKSKRSFDFAGPILDNIYGYSSSRAVVFTWFNLRLAYWIMIYIIVQTFM
jgi:hypothetical protein